MKWTKYHVCHDEFRSGGTCYTCKKQLLLEGYWHGSYERISLPEVTVCDYCFMNSTRGDLEDAVSKMYVAGVTPVECEETDPKIVRQFLIPKEKVRSYMWKQRLIHWVQLLVGTALLGGTGLGVNGIRGCLAVVKEREKVEYRISGVCDNCKSKVTVWIEDGTPMGEGVCPKCRVFFGEWKDG